MKKRMFLIILSIATIFIFAGCNSTTKSAQDAPQMGNSNEEKIDIQPEKASFDLDENITVVSREDGSGTRGAFAELFGIEVKNAEETKKDMTTRDADIINKTDVMLTSVATNEYSIGYASLASSSVSPIMEKLKEAYEKINPNAKIEMQMSDSSAGMASAMDGTCDIGMASRDLKDSEKEQLTSVAIALDGIAVIVNQENIMTNLTKEQVRQIFTGETVKWSEIK